MWVAVIAVNLAAGTLWRWSRLAAPSPALETASPGIG
jgi:hypothetical protein